MWILWISLVPISGECKISKFVAITTNSLTLSLHYSSIVHGKLRQATIIHCCGRFTLHSVIHWLHISLANVEIESGVNLWW